MASPISIHAPRVGRDLPRKNHHPRGKHISIHAPRVGRDERETTKNIKKRNFNPRAPCGARLGQQFGQLNDRLFQSTRPVWGATNYGRQRHTAAFRFQSTRPVWGATRTEVSGGYSRRISIHAPRVGRDNSHGMTQRLNGISIHAPRVGRDPSSLKQCQRMKHFNPRAPCGARRDNQGQIWWQGKFQSTRPVWGATRRFPQWTRRIQISIHAPRVGRDKSVRLVTEHGKISIHAPRVGRDSKFDDFTPSNLHKRYKRVLARPKNTREKGKIKQKLAYIHAFSAFLGCEGSGTFCALVLRTQYR